MVGCCNFIITLTVYKFASFILTYLIATSLAFLMSVINSFFMNKYFVFKSKSGDFLHFLLGNIPGLAVNNLSMYILIKNGVDDIVSQTISIIFVMVVNYSMFNLVFSSNRFMR